MDVIKENTIKFIDALIVDNYKGAHKFLEVIVNEKVKRKIGIAVKTQEPFKKELRENVENLKSSSLIKLMDYLPDGSSAQSGLFDFKDYHGGQTSHMYGVRSSGMIEISDIPNLKSEVQKAIRIASKHGEVEHEGNFKELYKELDKLTNRFKDIIESEDEEQYMNNISM
jgi:hypothetical protein